MEPFIGQIQAFGFNFAPRGWAKCDGQLLAISSNTALFSLIGTIYGGDGRTTFALPDLRGRTGIHQGTGPGLSPRPIGQRSGTQTNILNETNLPAHQHSINIPVAEEGDTDDPNDSFIARSETQSFASASDANNFLATANSESTGSNLAVNNMQPYLVTNYCIALFGIFPSRS